MIRVVFIHGLNTYGDDDLHIGPLHFGLMHAPWKNALEGRGCQFFALTGLGYGGPHEQAARAREALRLANWTDDFFIIGHSTGGLVARLLAEDATLKNGIRGIVTCGTPHHGSHAADLGLNFQNEFPRMTQLFATFGYDMVAKNTIFKNFTPLAMNAFNHDHPLVSDIPFSYSLCEVTRANLSWPLLAFYNRLHRPPFTPGASDGFVSSDSQAWGKCLGRFQLDHFGNLGFFFQISGKRRQEAQREFSRLVDAVVAWMYAQISPIHTISK